jgi:hypothetical protein
MFVTKIPLTSGEESKYGKPSGVLFGANLPLEIPKI